MGDEGRWVMNRYPQIQITTEEAMKPTKQMRDQLKRENKKWPEAVHA